MRSKLIARYYKENKGNPEINSIIAEAITKLDDPKQLAKFIRDMDEVSGLDMITEGWINMILISTPNSYSKHSW